MRRYFFAALVLSIFAAGDACLADTFGGGANSFEIEFVPIGDRGNLPDANPNPAGAVPYGYRMGKFEISESVIDKANALGGLGITKDMRGPDKPATSVTWFEAARFVNWLNESTGHMTAYKFDAHGNFQLWESNDLGYDPANLFRNGLATYFLPSIDEWYKAAYFNPADDSYYDFPTGSNNSPIAVASGTDAGTAVFSQGSGGPADIMQAGGLSPYETMAQGGNVYELIETEFDRINDSPASPRLLRGGDWSRGFEVLEASAGSSSFSPSSTRPSIGFRVASTIPEPSAVTLLCLGLTAVLGRRRRVY